MNKENRLLRKHKIWIILWTIVFSIVVLGATISYLVLSVVYIKQSYSIAIASILLIVSLFAIYQAMREITWGFQFFYKDCRKIENYPFSIETNKKWINFFKHFYMNRWDWMKKQYSKKRS
ncbi:hypothetical protein [Mycoplasma sp. 005V]|uniref:hypothetical protein n=1 Tax=unclassified Mycoplasma TaxID=2683645 RepID=UPI003A8A16EB